MSQFLVTQTAETDWTARELKILPRHMGSRSHTFMDLVSGLGILMVKVAK